MTLIYEIWKFQKFKIEHREIFKKNLKESAEREELFSKLHEFIEAFNAKLNSKLKNRHYNQVYNKDNFFDTFERVGLTHVFEAFDERTYSGNLYINMKRLEEIYEYCHNIEKMESLIYMGEFNTNKTSFLHYGSKIPPSQKVLSEELYVYTTPEGPANYKARLADALRRYEETSPDKKRELIEEEIRVREIWEKSLMQVVSNAVERAKSFIFTGEPTEIEIQELREAHIMREEIKRVQMAGRVAAGRVAAAAVATERAREADSKANYLMTNLPNKNVSQENKDKALRIAQEMMDTALKEKEFAEKIARKAAALVETAARIGRKVIEDAYARRAAPPPPPPPPPLLPLNVYAQDGGDLSKPVQTTTVPKVIIPGETLW
jgi:hypothetical protein